LSQPFLTLLCRLHVSKSFSTLYFPSVVLVVLFGPLVFYVMGKFAKLVNTEEKIVEFKKRYRIPEDVHIRYVPYGDLALVLYQDLVLPMVAIVEGGVRIPMHTFLLRFLAHFRLSPPSVCP
jgi:hypothetical protein